MLILLVVCLGDVNAFEEDDMAAIISSAAIRHDNIIRAWRGSTAAGSTEATGAIDSWLVRVSVDLCR